MKLLAALLLPALIVIGTATLETRFVGSSGSDKPARGIVWDSHTFPTRQDFARWLRSRGTSYRTWARRHPALSGVKPSRTARRSAQTRTEVEEKARQPGSIWSLEHVAEGIFALAFLGLGIVFIYRRRPPPGGLSRSPAFDSVVRGIVAAGESGARLTARWARVFALRSFVLATSATVIARAAGESGARLTARWARVFALRSYVLATSATVIARRRRSDLAWYLGMPLVAAGIGLVVTIWLNRT